MRLGPYEASFVGISDFDKNFTAMDNSICEHLTHNPIEFVSMTKRFSQLKYRDINSKYTIMLYMRKSAVREHKVYAKYIQYCFSKPAQSSFTRVFFFK